jgi:hypothetical protein
MLNMGGRTREWPESGCCAKRRVQPYSIQPTLRVHRVAWGGYLPRLRGPYLKIHVSLSLQHHVLSISTKVRLLSILHAVVQVSTLSSVTQARSGRFGVAHTYRRPSALDSSLRGNWCTRFNSTEHYLLDFQFNYRNYTTVGQNLT